MEPQGFWWETNEIDFALIPSVLSESLQHLPEWNTHSLCRRVCVMELWLSLDPAERSETCLSLTPERMNSLCSSARGHWGLLDLYRRLYIVIRGVWLTWVCVQWETQSTHTHTHTPHTTPAEIISLCTEKTEHEIVCVSIVSCRVCWWSQ